MSRDGASNRIDSLKNSLNSDHYSRTALGSAVRFNALLNIADGFSREAEENPNQRITKDEFVGRVASSVQELIDEYEEEFPGKERYSNDKTVQQRLQNKAYKTALGQSVAHATTQRKGMYQDFNTSYSTGATGAFRSFTNGFVKDDEDFFGSRVLYDNVFGLYEDGTESLSNRKAIAMSDPTNDNRTVSEKVLDDVVSRSIYDQTEIIDRVDIEFGRFHGQSMIDQASMTGSGLQAARQTIRNVISEGSAFGRQAAIRGGDDHPVALAQALMDRTNEDLDSTRSALNLLNNNLGNRSATNNSQEGGYVNKAGVAEFIDLINSAGTRDSNGALTGGRISITSFQFQNETISAALTDKIQRHVLESVLQGGGAPLQIDLTLAYPRQRNIDKRQDEDGRYAVGQTNYGILGPNLIEALKLEAVKENIQDMLKGLGVSPDQIDQYVNLNIGFRDKKFHPKVYLTDNVASIGTQNLTAPVGNSINQAGSNFETMRFVTNSLSDDELRQARHLGLQGRDSVYNNSITQSLLYRQIVNAVDQEREFSNRQFTRQQGNTSTPILSNIQGSQVGFAGDIYQHLKNTLDFAHTTAFGELNSLGDFPLKQSKANIQMFMVLDQAFMLQLGSSAYEKQLAGEMGKEIGTPYNAANEQSKQYKIRQNQLFDLLIADKAKVVVDTKNYREQVLTPLIDKINQDENVKLQSNFEKYGKSLSMMAGFDLFKPSSSQTKEEYDKSMKVMFSELRRLGFTSEAGFDDSDLKQIVGLASGNIEMATAPRQHAKEAALIDYSSGEARLISYIQSSSNFGLYSLGIGSGPNGEYREGDGDLTNTEMGIMLGNRNINSNLSRATSSVTTNKEFSEANNMISNNPGLKEWILNSQEEDYELELAQRHFSTTWKQLSQGSTIENPTLKNVNSAPIWQDNVNSKDLSLLRSRLELMAKDLGLDSNAFSIQERFSNVSGKGITSINVSINLSAALASKDAFMPTTINLPKLNFELTVLQGPQRGEGIFSDSRDDGQAPGFVYFVDKNKVVGNGLFVNDSGSDISLLGRHRYEDDFVSDMREGGRINLKSGQSAHMTSLDIVPQLFSTLMGEATSRFGTNAHIDTYNRMGGSEKETLLLDYVSTILTGHKSQMVRTNAPGSNTISSMSNIKNNLDILSLQDLNETINRHARALENASDSYTAESSKYEERRKQNIELSKDLAAFNNKWFHTLREEGSLNDRHIFNYISDLNNLTEKSPQLLSMIMKTAYKNPNQAGDLQAFKDFQTLLFGSFLQTRDDRSYGGQQGFYRTTLMGVGSSNADVNTASLMFDVNTEEASLNNNKAYARFKPLEYKPTTNIHDTLYRSIASKSTSMTKNNTELDSILLESEARDLGDAANLRLMSSIGIGNIMHRDDYIIRGDDGKIEVGQDQKAIFAAMEQVMRAGGADTSAIDNARQAYLQNMTNTFGSLDSEERGDTIRLNFYTGSAKKLSQLPQRIKNAMGARPMYQYSVDAQMALERGESLSDLSDNYLQQYREPLVAATKKKAMDLIEKRDALVKQVGEDHIEVQRLNNQIDDLKVIGAKAFNSKVAGLGAVFSGRIKSVLNQEQVDFISKTRDRLEASMGDLISKGELDQNVLDELIRVEVLKAGLGNKGLGKMIAGSNHMNYSIALVQLSGTYNDTFLANSLYGTTYKSKDSYENIRNSDVDIYKLDVEAREKIGVFNLGMKEGQYEVSKQSIKGSKIAAGGMEVLVQADDIIVEDKETGSYVQKRKVNGEWKIIGQVDGKRNLAIVKNLIDGRNSISGSALLGVKTTSVYGRTGEGSSDYIYTVDTREGNFANNEYLLLLGKLRSIDPSSGRRVEGTDASALVKGVAMFAGRVKYTSMQNQKLVYREKNVFEDLEDQIIKSYEQGEIKGSLKSYLDYRDETQRVTLQDGRTGYAPLSSSIHGLYNANNFKSFFWSHGATIIRAQNDEGKNFMLDNLFDTNNSVDNAKKLAASLLFNFGTDFVQQSQDSDASDITKLRRTLVESVVRGELGSHYQRLALVHAQTMGAKVDSIFNNGELRNNREKTEILTDLIFEKIGNQVGYNAASVGALGAITASQLQSALDGDKKAAKDLLNLVRKGIIDPISEKANRVGGINFTNSADRQAALITTAVDFMHQLSGSGSKLRIPSDVDFDSNKVREVLLAVLGLRGTSKDSLTEDIMSFLSGVNSDVTALSVFTDITFAYGKDPTGTETVAKHEAQHLITPFLGDIKKYQEGGKLHNLQSTVAGLMAMTTGASSGLVFYDSMAKAGFGEQKAINLVAESSDYLFSSFNKQNYLGFYQSGMSAVTTTDFVNEYKSINTSLLGGKYDWNPIQSVRDANDRTKFHSSDPGRQEGSLNSEAYNQVERYVGKFHQGATELEKARLVDKYLMMGGDRFAMHQLDELTNMMALENERYTPDYSKSGDATNNFLSNMNNEQKYFSIPYIDFDMQNGEIIAKPSKDKTISSMLPSAQQMQVLGVDYAGFVDPILTHYKNMASIFVPGTIANTVFEKVRLAAREGRAIVLSTEEYKAMQGVMDSAMRMPTELKIAEAGARTQEANAGKNKYSGFTATGIGSFLMPFDSVALSQSKLDEAGMQVNAARFQAIKESDIKIRELQEGLHSSTKELRQIKRDEERTLISETHQQNIYDLRMRVINDNSDDPGRTIPRPPLTIEERNRQNANALALRQLSREGDPWNVSKPIQKNPQLENAEYPNPNNQYISGKARKDFTREVKPQFKDRGILSKVITQSTGGSDESGLYKFSVFNTTVNSLSDEELINVFNKKQQDLDNLKNQNYYRPELGRSDENSTRLVAEYGTGINPVLPVLIGRIGAQKRALSREFRKRGLNPFLNQEKETQEKINTIDTERLISETEPTNIVEPETRINTDINYDNIRTSDSSIALDRNILTFYKRQRAAEAKGISYMLEEEFKTIKRESIDTKNKIIELADSAVLEVDARKAAFNTLHDAIKQKRDLAYKMAGLNPEDGNRINENGEYAAKLPTEEDRYIYHAQALNYDSLLAKVLIIGNQANLNPLSHDVVKELERKTQKISSVEFLLNSFEDRDGQSTFSSLGHKNSEMSERALFTGAAIDPEGGMVGKHMKVVKGISKNFASLNLPEEAQQAKVAYALSQIENTITMYKRRSENMQAFSAQREGYGMQVDNDGKQIIEPEAQRKIDEASKTYNAYTNEVIDYLENQKSKLMSGQVNDSDIRNVFEDIDVKITETDRANLGLAEVFRSPTPGGTDPRLHMYRVMQGVASLNQVSQMLSDNRQTGSDPKMIYSTERGQTATVLAALGVVTYGGGDYDGDPYTAIFVQMAPTQKAIQDYKAKVDQHKITLDILNKKISELERGLSAVDRTTSKGLDRAKSLTEHINAIKQNIVDTQERLNNDTAAFDEARLTLDQQIQVGHNGLQARARKQVANYLGIDEAFFVANGESMVDAQGKVMKNADGTEKTGISTDKTYDADAMFALFEKGYGLVEGVANKGGKIIAMMDNIEALLGYNSSPETFRNGEFLNEIVKGIERTDGKITNESPAIGMLKARVAQLQQGTQPLTDQQKQFVNSLGEASDDHYKAYLEQFDTIQKSMESAEAIHRLENNQKVEEKRSEFSRRAFVNQWIGGNLYSAMTSDETLSKFMSQGVGMTLTEGTFDMTLKTLGKAGGEVLGKTYNTIIGTTFQDAPIIAYGRQMLEDGDLANATKSEFARQLEGDSEYMSKIRQEVESEGLVKGSAEFNTRVNQRIQDQALGKFEEYQEYTRKAVLKSEGTQGFMKNIHQLLRDSIKLNDGDGGLISRLKEASVQYDDLSKQIMANDNEGGDKSKQSELMNARDKIITDMASNLGPGPGLKSLINLDYLTNESDRQGLSKTEFEERFLGKDAGNLDSNRQMLIEYSHSMKELSEVEREELRNVDTITDESSALLKVARNMTAKNLSNLVTAFRMDATAVQGREDLIKGFTRDHKASLATKIEAHYIKTGERPSSNTQDGDINFADEAKKYIETKYGIIEGDNHGAKFDANRQHKNALGIHLGIEESHLYNENGTITEAYTNKLTEAASKLGMSNEEYALMFDIHHEQSREQVSGLFGVDGEKMAQFTVMNMMRKDIARSMLDGRVPSASSSKVLNENIGSEVLTTMAQLASQGKLDSQGIDVFSGMYKGVMGQLLDATDSVVTYKRKGDDSGVLHEMKFSEMTEQQKSAYMTKLLYQTMLGTEVNSESGFTRSTSDEARDWKSFNGALIANSTLELDENGRLGNEFIDALDKAGANTVTGQQVAMGEQMGLEYLRTSLDSEAGFQSLMDQYLPNRGALGSEGDKKYREQMTRKVRTQILARQEADSRKYAASRERHGKNKGVLHRTSFLNNVDGGVLKQLSTDTSANALDLFVPLILTAVGSAVGEGSVGGDELMNLGGAAFTSFQYARTGMIESTKMEAAQYKKKLGQASAISGVFKFKNAMAQNDENVGAAIAQVAIQEVTAATFNTIAAPWLSRKIAENGLGIKHAPALNSLDTRKYAASQQLAGNLGASLISAVSSTLISGLLMRGAESMMGSIGDTIASFMPAANAVNAVTEAISKRRQQEAAFSDFQAETDNAEGQIVDYMVMTDSTYDTTKYSSLESLNEPQDIEPSSDGTLSIGLYGES